MLFRLAAATSLSILLSAVTSAVQPIEPPMRAGKPGPAMSPKEAQRMENQPRVFEFSADEIGVVLRAVARQARMNVVISESVKGTVTLRLEDRTPREAIEVICKANELDIQELNGVHYIRCWDDMIKADAKKMAHVVKLMVDAYMEKGFSRAEAMELIESPSLPRIEVPVPAHSPKPSKR
jgi:hypothetical protein